MKRLFVFSLIAILVVSCSPKSPIEPTQTAIPETATVEPTSTFTIEPTTTNTPQPTKTKLPTNTPRPTNTKAPTNTPTATQAPVVFNGSGDDVIDLNKWNGVALLYIKYTGSRNFIIQSIDSAGEQIDLLVNTIGEYEGTKIIDVVDDEYTQRLSIKSSGNWEIHLLPFDMIRIVDIPTTFEGVGDDVVLLDGGSKVPDLLKIDASSASHNFIIFGYGSSMDLLVNEIAPYTGTVIISNRLLTTNGLVVLEVTASGSWKIEATVR